MSLLYGLREYPEGYVIHVLINGYSYKAEVLCSDNETVQVKVISTGKIYNIPKTQTFR